MFQIGIGTGLLAIGFLAQYVIKKRLQDKTLKVAYMWVAWICAVMGGLSVSTDVGSRIGLTGWGASVVSILGLIWLAADLKDKRPDWGAFYLAAILPLTMRLAGGPVGQFFQFLLSPFQALALFMASGLGG